ncbi:MAG: cytochrome c-type biogenesis protein CcmH [Chromatiales bacterium]|nr:MAG: cytochrome c-type biogenesis protein CcmH [Chromatiales bacterium]
MRHWLTLLLVGLWLAAPALAIEAELPIADPEQRELYDRLTNETRCLVCQNQTIADSNAALAVDLRREIRGMVEAGQAEDEIKTFLTDRYGEFVLYRPRWSAATAVLWLAPAVLVLLGALWLWRIVQRRAALPVTSEEQDALDA